MKDKVKRNLALTTLIVLVLVVAACGDQAMPTIPAVATATPKPVTTATTTTLAPITTLVPTVTVPPQTTAKPAPGSGKLVYSTENKEIFIVNPDGSGKKKIATGSDPIFSPDGKRIAFVESKGEYFSTTNPQRSTLVTTNIDGSDRQELCSGLPNHLMFPQMWSPRNRFIAVTQVPYATDAFPKAYLCNLSDKKTITLVKVKQGEVYFTYEWTPDGENAIWQVSDGKTGYEVYYGDPDKAGEGAINLTKGQNAGGGLGDLTLYYASHISPDGKTIAIHGKQLFFVAVPGQNSPLNTKQIAPFNTVSRFAWSPDGSQIVFHEYNTTGLKIMNIATGKITNIAEDAVSADWSKV